MEYAPIIIPTLNRDVHLKRCLDSLASNTGAQLTEVYISVDYPPHEKYYEGYEKVKLLLEEFDFSVFKDVHIFVQDRNLGPRENIYFLQEKAKEKSNRYILTEDDNDFAPNFLEYINQGLEVFEENDNVLGICGAKDTEWMFGDKDIAFSKLFAAYGYGSWFDKEEKMRAEGEKLLLSPKTLSLNSMKNLWVKNKTLFAIYISDILCAEKGLFWLGNKLYWCDTVRSIYMHLTDKVCIVPLKVKSRTWGNDGSGVNMASKEINPEIEWPLDTDSKFLFRKYESLEYIDENYALGDHYLKQCRTIKGIIKAIVLYVLLLICKKNRYVVIKLWKK